MRPLTVRPCGGVRCVLQLEDAVTFIERALSRSPGAGRGAAEQGPQAAEPCVLVHCEAGQSRSVAVVAAYLMRAEGHTPEEAVRRSHPPKKGGLVLDPLRVDPS